MTNRMNRMLSRRAIFGIAGTAAIAAVLTACMSSKNVVGFGSKVNVGTVEDVKTTLASQKYVRNAEGHFYLLSASAGSAIAVYWKCTHLGCTVPLPDVQKGTITCPCHNAVYDAQTGTVTGGPTPQPLDYMPITITNGNIVVDTGKTMTRAAFDVGQTVPLG